MASPLLTLRRWIRRPRARLLDAERAFFDAYGRGGERRHERLVVPIDFFTRAEVKRVLEAWLVGGESLDTGALERNWRAEDGRGEAADFYANLAHYVSLVRRAY